MIKSSKNLSLWQMCALELLIVFILITMFLPAYHINGKAVAKMYQKIVSNEKSGWVDRFVDIDNLQDEIDDQITDLEKEYGIRISSIRPVRIMTHSYQSFFGDEDNDEEIFSGLKSAYTKQRILLWVVYLLAVAVILLLIYSYQSQWVKYIPLAVSGLYGLIAAAIFWVFQFKVPRSAAKVDGLRNILGLGDYINSSIAKLIYSFWGIAFLAGCILAVLLIIISVIFVFTGNVSRELVIKNRSLQPSVIYTPSPEDNVQPQFEPKQKLTGQESILSKVNPKAMLEQTSAPEVMMVPVGQVQCTKGAAEGQEASVWDNRQIVVGRSRRNANLILDDPKISNVHCIIGYNAAANSYVVIDRSTNGTFVNGKKLQKDVAVKLAAGTRLQLADGSNEIKLG